MKKKKFTAVLAALGLLASLSSCYFMNPNYRISWNHPSTETKTTDKVSYGTPDYSSSFSKDNLNKDTVGYGLGYKYMPSTGDRKILVVPVETTDYTFSDSYGSDWRTTLEHGFFGDSSDTGWESVSSFYEKSSYGKLHISGEVTPVINLNVTSSKLSSLNDSYSEKGMNYTDILLDEVINTLNKDTDINFADYDTDKDGFIDAVWLVYSVPYRQTSQLFWAYTTWAQDASSYDGVTPCCYSWASFKFLTEMDYRPKGTTSYANYSDAHTFIHETGHILGLDDYYSYDYDYSASKPDGNADTPVGGIDMMDFNIGDHCAFSKYLLGWKTPTLVTEEYLQENNYTITLSSLVETGDSLLIPRYKDGNMDFNGTPFDEYLIVEFYTPTSLNQKDVTGYGISRQKTYTQPGVLVYHVDARVGKLVADSKGNASWDGNAYDKLPSPGSDRNWRRTYTYSYIYSNTKTYCYDQSLSDSGLSFYRGRLISLLPSNGKKVEGSKTGYSSDRCLYRSGNAFTSQKYDSFMFDDGSLPQFGFQVSSTSTSCSLKFMEF